MRKVYAVFAVVVLFFVSSTVAGCSSANQDRGSNASASHVAMAEAGMMPAAVRTAPKVVQEAYQFAAANRTVLEQIPCYCGCGPMGHASNYACFWQEDGRLDQHALGCGICVDIAQDTRRALEQGQPLDQIRQQIDADYSRFGPPTDTPAVVSLAR